MNKKQIVKASVTYYGFSAPQQMYGVMIDDNRVLLENGQMGDLSANVQVSATRNVPPEVRAVLEEAYSKVIEMDKLNKQILALDEKYHQLKREIGEGVPEDIRRAKGLLTRKEFTDEFFSRLPSALQDAIKSCKYSVYLDYDEENVKITREVPIQKWYRTENEICYQEYDGEMFIADNAENTKTYQDYIRRYSVLLPKVECKAYECLFFGDKSTLTYGCSYNVPITKPLTKEHAKELADKFAGTKTAQKKKTDYERD